jgi:hypothetical protein
MVRFHRDRWYSASGQQELRARIQKEKTSPTLHLIKLFVLLAVVIVVMRQSANPKVYDGFFRAITGSPIATDPTKSEKTSQPNSDQQATAAIPSDKPAAQVVKEQIWLQLFNRAPASDIDLIGRRVFSAEPQSDSFEFKPVSEETVSAFRDRIQNWLAEYEAAGLQDSDGATQLRAFQDDWPTWEAWLKSNNPKLPAELAEQATQAFRDALDSALIKTMRDGSQWRTVEHAAFSRALQLAIDRGQQNASARGPLVETLMLDGEIDTYRGQWVRFRGSVARGPEKQVAKSPEFGLVEYWVTWLRPLDSSNQPVCIYFAKEPAAAPTSDPTSETTEVPNWVVEVEARVLKRLAYAAQSGIEVAPVLMAANATWYRDTELANMPTTTSRPTPPAQLWSPPSRDVTLARSLKLVLESPMKILTPAIVDQLASTKLSEPDLSVVQLLFQLRRQSDVVKQLASVSEQVRMGIPLRSIQGWVTQVDAIPLTSEMQEWFDSPSIYRMKLESFSTQTLPSMSWVIYSAQIPKFWLEKSEIKQPITAAGLVLDASGELPSLLMTPDVDWSWSDDLANDQFVPALPDHMFRLGNQRWDLGQLDSLKELQTKSLASSETRAFYSLLNLAPKLPLPTDPTHVPIIETLKRPNDLALQDVKTTINIIRIARVSVQDPDQAAWLDGDSYYQIDGMAGLGNERVQITGAPGTPKIEFEGKYPVTLVVKDLPKWLLSANPSAESQDPYRSLETSDVWYPRVLAEADGIFYRLWGYTSQAIEKQGEAARQFGPLIFARNINPSTNTSSNVLRNQLNYMTLFILLAVAGIVWLGFTLNRGKRKTDFSLPSRRDKKPDAKVDTKE